MLVDLKRDHSRLSPEGLWSIYDTLRGRWLSANREKFIFSINHARACAIRSMTINSGLPSSVNGCPLLRAALVTSVAIKVKELTTANFSFGVLRNSAFIEIQAVSLSDESNQTVLNLDHEVQLGDSLAVILESGQCDYPVALIEAAWMY